MSTIADVGSSCVPRHTVRRVVSKFEGSSFGFRRLVLGSTGILKEKRGCLGKEMANLKAASYKN
jgi:hypothetical protein